MIVIDTNVISEMMRADPDPRVLGWAGTVGRLHTTVITLADVDYGLTRLPAGRGRDRLMASAVDIFAEFADVILPFDARAARRCGGIVVDRETAGLPISSGDAQIAAICAAHDAILATRNTGDFESTGIQVVNPWLTNPGPGRV